MAPASRKVVQKAIAMIVIVAMLDLVGFSPTLIVFFFLAGFVVWLVILRSHRRDAKEVFEFYLAADEILRDEERHWYGFEISEVINRGERVLGGLPDAPPLLYFSLAALHHRAGEHQEAVEYLALLMETDLAQEHNRLNPSPALRRYVQMLRDIEREPATAPMALAALRSLERLRRDRGAAFLADSRARLQSADTESAQPATEGNTSLSTPAVCSMPYNVSAPRPISEVLHDVYQEETPI